MQKRVWLFINTNVLAHEFSHSYARIVVMEVFDYEVFRNLSADHDWWLHPGLAE